MQYYIRSIIYIKNLYFVHILCTQSITHLLYVQRIDYTRYTIHLCCMLCAVYSLYTMHTGYLINI